MIPVCNRAVSCRFSCLEQLADYPVRADSAVRHRPVFYKRHSEGAPVNIAARVRYFLQRLVQVIVLDRSPQTGHPRANALFRSIVSPVSPVSRLSKQPRRP